MIKVEITKDKSLIKAVQVKGHAKSDEQGKDLVCAAVSAIVTGTINYLDLTKDKVIFALDEGYSFIEFENDNSSQIIANMLITQLKTIEESQKKFIKIINL